MHFFAVFFLYKVAKFTFYKVALTLSLWIKFFSVTFKFITVTEQAFSVRSSFYCAVQYKVALIVLSL